MNGAPIDKKRITFWFNVALSLYLLAHEIGQFLIRPIDRKKTSLDSIFPGDESIGILVALIGILLVGGTVLVREFWCRFVTDIFSVREITMQEAFSLLLICMLFFNVPA